MEIIGTTPAEAANEAIDKAIASVLLRKLELRIYFLFLSGLYDELNDSIVLDLLFYKFLIWFNALFVLNLILKKFVWGFKCFTKSYSVRIIKYDDHENYKEVSKKKKS